MRKRELGPVLVTLPGGKAYQSMNGPSPSYIGADLPWAPNAVEPKALTRHEYMEDREDPKPPCGFKPCDHVSLDLTWTALQSLSGGHYTPLGPVNWVLPAGTALTSWHPEVLAYVESLVTPDEVAEFSHDDFWRMSHAWENAKPQIKPEVDLLVFLAEADELPKLAVSLKKKIGGLFSSVGKNASQYLDGLSVLKKHEGTRGVLKVVTNEAGDALSSQWLEYNFAIAPLVNDLVGLINGILSFDKKLKELLAGASKPQKVSCSFTTVDEKAPTIITQVDDCTVCPTRAYGPCIYASPDGTYERAKGKRSRVRYPGGVETRVGLTVFYRYSLPEWVSDFSGRVNALAASLGINPGLGTIWELIPFSFVLDWVYPIGSLLEQARFDALPVKTEVIDVCFSKRETTNMLIQARVHPCCPYQDDMSVATGRLIKYKRIVGYEHFTKIPSFRWPNWFQLSLGAALAQGLRDWRSRF